MANDTSPNKTDDARAAAENLASRAGTAAHKVGDAARSAGRWAPSPVRNWPISELIWTTSFPASPVYRI